MELWEIVDNGKIERLEELLDSGFDINQGDEFGSALLHHASQMGRLEMVDFLLQKGANVNALDSEESTPLIAAAQENHRDIVQLLLDKGADPNCGRSMNGMALHCAAFHGEVEIGKLLIEHGADINKIDNEADCWTPLHCAAYKNHLEFTKMLVEAGANLYAMAGMCWPMDEALEQGHKDVAQYLYMLVENAHPGSLGTPLHAAAGFRDIHLLSRLMDDYEIDVRDYASRTPLHWAAGRERLLFFRIILELYEQIMKFKLPSNLCRGEAWAAIKYLLDKGADIEGKDYANNTPLLIALQLGQEDAAEFLIKQGADINVADNTGWTPLILASSGGRLSVLKMLLDRGAKMDAIRDGWNALNYACHHGKENAAKYLLDRGMDVNGPRQDTWRPYPLFSAIFMGHISIVKLLLDRGADISLKDKQGNNALSMARGNKKIVDMLKQHGNKQKR